MKESRFSALCLIAALSLLASIHGVSGQVISPSAQNVASRPVASRSAPAARPIANTSIAPRVACAGEFQAPNVQQICTSHDWPTGDDESSAKLFAGDAGAE